MLEPVAARLAAPELEPNGMPADPFEDPSSGLGSLERLASSGRARYSLALASRTDSSAGAPNPRITRPPAPALAIGGCASAYRTLRMPIPTNPHLEPIEPMRAAGEPIHRAPIHCRRCRMLEPLHGVPFFRGGGAL
jgi:hypothetical protein